MRTESLNPALKQLFDMTPGVEGPSIMSRCEGFIEQGGSVFDLLKMGRRGIVDRLGLHTRDAQVLLDRATSLMVYAAREYREYRLLKQTPRNPLHRTGVRAWVDAPTYDDLFKTDWENCAPKNGQSADAAATAYLVDLCRLARDLEKGAGGTPIKLEERRPDITDFKLDAMSLNQVKPSITLINEGLEDIIKKTVTLQKDQVVDDLMLETRFPFRSMPFEWYHEQWSQVLALNNLTLGEVVRTIDPTAPYFKQKGGRGMYADIALRQSCGIGPMGQSLLTENFYFPITPAEEAARSFEREAAGTLTIDDFLKTNFGSTQVKLTDSKHLCDQTSIDAQKLVDFLSIEEHTPTVSKNQDIFIEDELTVVGPQNFGSVFINNADVPALGLSAAQKDTTRTLEGHSNNRWDRINRMLRLARWTGLGYHDCDRIVVAANHAEQRQRQPSQAIETSETAGTAKPDRYRITFNTLRALGLEREFRQQFKCPAEDFAAMIDEISIFGRGEQASQFDRIFNEKALFDTPLIIDNRVFSIMGNTRDDRRTIDQICSALGLNQEAWRYLARAISKSHGLINELRCSLPILSSFFRCVKLASLLRISPIELCAMLEVISERGTAGLLQKITGESHIAIGGASGDGDVLHVMRAAADCMVWCRENDIGVQWLVQHIAPVIVPPLATAAHINLLETMHKRLQPVLFTEARLLAAGVPQARHYDWMYLLARVVDRNGLLIALAASDGVAYEQLARVEIEAAVSKDQEGLPDGELDPDASVRTVSAILAVVLQIKAFQAALVGEGLSRHLDLSQDLTLPLLKWVNQGGVYLLLTETIRALNAVVSGTDKIRIGDEVLTFLANLERRAGVVKKLELSSAMLMTVTTGQNWRWFGVQQTEDLTLHTLLNMMLYRNAVKQTGQSAENLLNYLHLVNSLPAYLTDEDLRLIRDSAASRLAQVLKWGVREILECVMYLSPSRPIVQDLTTLGALMRIRGLAINSGLDAKSIIALGMLTPDSHKDDCRSAAEHLMEVLSEASIKGHSGSFGELGQSSTAEINCIGTPLIANKKNEVALIELKIRDLTDKPYENITVRWSCDRPGLLDEMSYTDQSGRAVARFKAANWMGIAHVKALYGLEQIVLAQVLIDCDEATLGVIFDNKALANKEYLAGGLEFMPIEVQLVDHGSNPGRGRTIEFSGRGVIVNPQAVVTDEQGFARTRVSSMEPVTDASVLARYPGSNSMVIGSINFVDRPYILRMETVSMAVKDSPLRLACYVVRLDKKPGVDIPVTLEYADGPSDPVMTDPNGIAWFDIASPAQGQQTFTAKVESGEQSLSVYVAEKAVMYSQSTDYLFPVAGSGAPTLLWVEVREEPYNQARAIANCSIEWIVTPPAASELDPVVVLTDEQGRSTFAFEAETSGRYKVTARRMDKPTETKEFDLEVLKALDWQFSLVDQADTGNPSTELPLQLVRGHEYELVIELPSDVNLNGARAMLGWSADYSPQGLGMDFNPLTGAYVLIGDDKNLKWTIKCGDVLNGSFALTFLCNRIDQRLVLSGRLDAPSPTLTSPSGEDTKSVERQPLLIGTGSPHAEIYVFEGRNGSLLLSRTSMDKHGSWSTRLPKPLALGPHVISLKQRHADTTEAWATDTPITVTNVIAKAQITSPPRDAKVRPSSWIEGLGMPGAEIEVFKHSTQEVLAKGAVAEDGRWRIKFTADLVTGKLLLNPQLTMDGDKSALWEEGYPIEVLNRS
ncbi:Tc toxin subunit A [Pseudomonas sp. XS1P51]